MASVAARSPTGGTAIGIKKGQPFNPDERMKKILTEAADVGAVTARALTACPRDQRHYLYPGEGVWTNPFIDGRYDFLEGGVRLLDSRIYIHWKHGAEERHHAVDADCLSRIVYATGIFRLYGPLQPFYDQTWRPGDPVQDEITSLTDTTQAKP